MTTNANYIIPFHELSMNDTATVGGKNASLGEMIQHLKAEGINVPGGFAITAQAYYDFIAFNTLAPMIQCNLNRLNTQTLDNLAEVASSCRKLIMNGSLQTKLEEEVRAAYQKLSPDYGAVAVRSSATAEDSPTASFAGQHDSYLNIAGEDSLLLSVKKSYASLFNDRAIKYRIDNGFSHMQVGQSVGVQIMVRSDKGSAGVTFTIEPENGNENLIYVTGSWGLGESVVQGAVITDEFYLFKPALEQNKNAIIHHQLGDKQQMLVYGNTSDAATVWQATPTGLRNDFVLTDAELQLLGNWSLKIEKHYGKAMDIEWAKDGISQQLYIVQARPETIHSKVKKPTLKEYQLIQKPEALLTGKAVGRSVITGKVCIVKSLMDAYKVNIGDVIVADITNPDWNTLLKKAICIVTNKGGRTSHASIVARELGIPAVVGTSNATEKLSDGQTITVACISGDVGHVYPGKIEWIEKEILLEDIAHTKTKAMFILADPMRALQLATYPNAGVGLLRMEFIISNILQIHPMALVKFDQLHNTPEKTKIEALTRSYPDKKTFFIDKLSEGIAMVAAAFYPYDVIVRLSDFKTNEYAKLLGGQWFEPEEENPMLGFRGASRYYHERYREGFGLECAALLKVRNEMSLTNVKVMIPFCRTLEEGRKVLETMKSFGLERGKNGLAVYVMAEIPSNVILAKDFAHLFDGFSIGSNDLTQLTLGLDRDSAIISDLFNESNEAVTTLIQQLIDTAHHEGVPVGLCGQAPSDLPEFAQFLVECGIDSISFSPDALIQGIENIKKAEANLKSKGELKLEEALHEI